MHTPNTGDTIRLNDPNTPHATAARAIAEYIEVATKVAYHSHQRDPHLSSDLRHELVKRVSLRLLSKGGQS